MADYLPRKLVRYVFVALLGFVTSNACAQPPPPPQQPQVPVAVPVPVQAQLSAPTAQVAESPQTRHMLDLLNHLNQMENEIRQLRGDIEVMGHDLQGVKDRQRQLYLDMDRRLRELELGAVRPSAAAPTTSPSAPAVAVPPAAAVGAAPTVAPPAGDTGTPALTLPSPPERDAYEKAFNLLKDGRYPQSIKAFQAFLKAHPKSSYADNAQYWLGEANYVSRNFKQALEEFGKVVKVYPNSPKVPDAMLKLGFTYYELGQWGQARSVLQDVIQRYPSSTARSLAGTRLQRMSKEGH